MRHGKQPARLVVAAGAVLLAAVPSSAGRLPSQVCPGGRFTLSHDAHLVVGGTAGAGTDAVVVQGVRIEIAGRCPASVGKVKATRKGTRVSARWKSCGDLHHLHLHALIRPDCNAMSGRLLARASRPQRFEATRSACGDGIVDSGAGEECEGTCASGQPCTTACTCEGSTSTTATSTTTTLAECFEPFTPVVPDVFQVLLSRLDPAADFDVPAGCSRAVPVCCPGGRAVSPCGPLHFALLSGEPPPSLVPVDGVPDHFRFSFRVKLTTVADVPVSVPLVGDCGVHVDTAGGTSRTVALSMEIALSPDHVRMSQVGSLTVTGLTKDDVDLTGSVACRIANLGLGAFVDILTSAFGNLATFRDLCRLCDSHAIVQCGS